MTSASVQCAGRLARRVAGIALVGSLLGDSLGTTQLRAQSPGRQRQLETIAILMAGHAAFADGHYDDAIRQYELARQRGSRFSGLPDLIQTVEHRRRLGDIAPADTHRIGIIYVVELRTLRRDGTWERRPDVTDDQKATWRVYRGVVSRILEAISEGRWTLAFDETDAVSTRTEGSSLNPHNPDHLDLERYFFEHADRHDSYATFSNTVSPARGLARRYPYVNGVLYGPHRGLMLLNAGNHGFGVLLHEFFHTIEWGARISPAHGMNREVRHNFPDWTGQTELDYYRWHFATTLRDYDFGRLDFTARYRRFSGDVSAAYGRIAAAYERIPLTSRLEARRLAEEAGQLVRSDSARALELYRRALALSPYDPEALAALVGALRAAPAPASESLAVYARRLADARALGEFREVAALPEARALGVPVGRWWPDQVTPEGHDTEWEVTDDVTSAGTFEVSFWHTGGWQALAIEWAALLEDGREVARDAHPGRSGRDRRDITYALPLSVHRPGARYVVRARISGVNGTDSNGLLLLRRR